MAVDGKGTDAGAKIASLKTLAEGSDVPVVFKDSAAKQPPRRRRKYSSCLQPMNITVS